MNLETCWARCAILLLHTVYWDLERYFWKVSGESCLPTLVRVSLLPYLFYAGLFSLRNGASARKTYKQRESESMCTERHKKIREKLEKSKSTMMWYERGVEWETVRGWGRWIEKDERRKLNNAGDSNLPVPMYLHRICQRGSVFLP